MRFCFAVALLALVLSACGPVDSGLDASLDAGSADAGPRDAGSDAADSGQEADAGETLDAGVPADAGAPDAGTLDAGSEDAGLPPEGFGALSGACGVLDTELVAAEPSLHTNHLDFGTDPYDPGDLGLLTPGGQEIISDGNAGGSSLYSEVFAYEVLARCEDAALLKTETEIVYDLASKITDLLVEVDGYRIGVSVTRAFAWPIGTEYTVASAQNLLEGKLGDILQSSGAVSDQDRWIKQILHVIAYNAQHADSVAQAFERIDPSVKADTIVVVTVSDGDDAFLY